jgi:hypothetical protein
MAVIVGEHHKEDKLAVEVGSPAAEVGSLAAEVDSLADSHHIEEEELGIHDCFDEDLPKWLFVYCG